MTIDLDLIPTSKARWIEDQNKSAAERWDDIRIATDILEMRYEDMFGVTLVRFENEFHKLDGMIVKDKKIVGIYETKTRDCDIAHLRNHGLILTHDKVVAGKQIAEKIGVPFFFIAACKHDDAMVVIEVFDGDGNQLVPFEVRENDETSAGMRGGRALRTNAYFDVSHAKIFERGACA